MGWVILVILIALIAAFFDSTVGKIVLGATVLAIGLLLLRWITGFAVFAILAKVCAAVIVIVLVGSILLSLLSK